MLSTALRIAHKDLRLILARGTGLIQALLLGLLLIFVFSLSRQAGEIMPPQSAAAIFWLASAFCQVLICNTLYSIEEANAARLGLLLAPAPTQAIWLGKTFAGLLLLLCAQLIFIPATIVFLGQPVTALWPAGLFIVLLVDVGIMALGSLLGALSQGQAARESMLSIILFPLLIPVLLAGISVGTAAFSGNMPENPESWFGIAAAFDALFLGACLFLFPYIYSEEE